MAGTAAPRLRTPRTGAPSLRTPRAGNYRGGRNVGTILGYRSGRRATGLFRGYYGRRNFGWNFGNNCFYQPWSFGIGLGWGYNYFDPFCNVGNFGWPQTPWCAWRSSIWNNCYSSCYWNSWSQPSNLAFNYWWYPQSTYCPTYLYVPSSVIVDDPVYVDAGEPVAAGSSIASLARSAEGDVTVDESESPSPVTLATKYVELGDFYFENARYEEAAEAYAKARNYAPDDASVHFVLADAVFANGDYHYAAFLIAEAVRLDPTIVTAETDKRAFYGDVKQFEDQMTALQKYIADKPYDAWAQLVLAYNLRFSERPARAIVAFKRVLELDPGNPAAQTFLDDLMPPKVEDAKPAATAPLKKTG